MFQIYKKVKTTEPENPDAELENQDEPLSPTPDKQDKPAKPEKHLAPSAPSISVQYEHIGKVSSFFSDLIGFEVLLSLHRDAKILMFCKTCRMFAFGFLSVMLVVYLVELDFNPKDVGLMFTLTLLGDAVISILMTSQADKWGRRKTLIMSAVLAIFTSIMFASQSNFWVLLVSAIFGVISPSGNEIGPFMAIELSGLSQVTRGEDRTRLMAWYNLVGCFSSAVGALCCGAIIGYLNGTMGFGLLAAYRVTMSVYAGVKIVLLCLFCFLGPDIEVPPAAPTPDKTVNPVSLFLGLHESKGVVVKLSFLFMLDAFAGSFVLQSIMSGWFHSKYNTSYTTLGTMVFICNIVAGVSALFAAKLADRIGLILTMVVTHVPSNILLILVPLMPNETLAIIMLCARYCISQMDSPTRNAYVQGVVHPDERSAANGVTNVVRSIGGSSGPYLAGLLFANPKLMNYPWIIAGVLKIIYDFLLLYNMHSVRPDVEIEKASKDASRELNELKAHTEYTLNALNASYRSNMSNIGSIGDRGSMGNMVRDGREGVEMTGMTGMTGMNGMSGGLRKEKYARVRFSDEEEVGMIESKEMNYGRLPDDDDEELRMIKEKYLRIRQDEEEEIRMVKERRNHRLERIEEDEVIVENGTRTHLSSQVEEWRQDGERGDGKMEEGRISFTMMQPEPVFELESAEIEEANRELNELKAHTEFTLNALNASYRDNMGNMGSVGHIGPTGGVGGIAGIGGTGGIVTGGRETSYLDTEKGTNMIDGSSATV